MSKLPKFPLNDDDLSFHDIRLRLYMEVDIHCFKKDEVLIGDTKRSNTKNGNESKG